jgi:CheY-like chemotaxis protein
MRKPVGAESGSTVESDKAKTEDSVRIMMADDHFPDVVLVKEALRSNGICFQMEVYGDGDSALKYVTSADRAEARPDLVILDLNLSHVSGLDVLREIRTRPAFDRIPVAILTSSLSSRERAQALQLKADAFISKPSHLEEFLSMVGSALRELLNRKSSDGTDRALTT